MSNNTPFKIYPRGFLGVRLEGRVERRALLNDTNLGVRFFQSIMMANRNDVDHSNPDVEALYAQYIRREAQTLSFDYRKKVLIVALAAFGTSQFDFWYRLQLKSPTIADLHRRFLEDTLRFIRTGKREMALETWNVLVTADDKGEQKSELSEYANEFFGISSGGYSRYSQNTSLTEVIQNWCSQPNGFEDLLGTLHVLFGKE